MCFSVFMSFFRSFLSFSKSEVTAIPSRCGVNLLITSRCIQRVFRDDVDEDSAAKLLAAVDWRKKRRKREEKRRKEKEREEKWSQRFSKCVRNEFEMNSKWPSKQLNLALSEIPKRVSQVCQHVTRSPSALIGAHSAAASKAALHWSSSSLDSSLWHETRINIY